MKKADIRLLLGELEIEDPLPHGDGFMVCCPLAKWTHEKGTDDSPSMGVKVQDAKRSFYNCFACKHSGPLYNLPYLIAQFYYHDGDEEKANKFFRISEVVKEYDRPTLAARFKACSDAKNNADDKQEEAVKLSPKVLELFEPYKDSLEALDYANKRKITSRIGSRYNLLYDAGCKRLVFPVYDAESNVVGAVGRSIEEDCAKRYYNYFGFKSGHSLGGLNRIYENKSKTLLVEGYFDLLNLAQYADEFDFNILCVWKASLSKNQLQTLSELDTSFVCLFDCDKAGDEGYAKLKRDLGGVVYGLSRRRWNGDIDPGEFSRTELEEILKSKAIK